MVIEYQQLARDRRSQNRSIQIDKSFTVDGVFSFSAKCTISFKKNPYNTENKVSLEMPVFDGSGQRVQYFALFFSQSQKGIFPQIHSRDFLI